MLGRHLRLPSSSDEDDGDHIPPPNPNPIPAPDTSLPLVISDDEFVDVPDELPNTSPPPPIPNRTGEGMEPEYAAVRPIDDFLGGLGLRLRLEWLASCAAGLASSGSGFQSSDVAGKAKMCFEQLLLSDLNHCGAGVLPPGVHEMHKAELKGPFVLQVDEVVNICSSLRERYHDAPAGLKRCLKLSLTDGVQRVFGMEYRSIRELSVFAPAGLKVVIRNVQIWRGLLILVPEVLEVLGGMVESLVAAHKRVVDEVNRPPRGKRKQCLLPLSTRASLAAWSSDVLHSTAQENNSVPQNPVDSRPTARASSVTTTNNNSGETTIEEIDNRHTRRKLTEEPTRRHNEGNIGQTQEPTRQHNEGNIGQTQEPTRQHNEGNIGQTQEPTHQHNARQHNEGNIGQTQEPTRQHNACQHNEGNIGQVFANCRTRGNLTEEPTRQHNEGNIGQAFAAPRTQGSFVDKQASATSRHDMEPSTILGSTTNVDDCQTSNAADDFTEVVHPVILRGEKESPFTYLASLSAKWTTNKDSTSFIRGKIKCVLTGVKLFHFKARRTYELQVFVDDGSLISEVLIDHNVVHKGIGHSPEQVNAALSSSDKEIASDMRECMKRFQQFLAKFEGTMLLEMNKMSPLPVAIEMDQGCSTADAWLLLRRLKRTAPLESQCTNLEPINLSP